MFSCLQLLHGIASIFFDASSGGKRSLSDSKDRQTLTHLHLAEKLLPSGPQNANRHNLSVVPVAALLRGSLGGLLMVALSVGGATCSMFRLRPGSAFPSPRTLR